MCISDVYCVLLSLPASVLAGGLAAGGMEMERVGKAAERDLVLRRECAYSPFAAYVHGVIKVKDLQSTPGPQQPLTLSGITEHDLQRCRSPSFLSSNLY